MMKIFCVIHHSPIQIRKLRSDFKVIVLRKKLRVFEWWCKVIISYQANNIQAKTLNILRERTVMILIQFVKCFC